MAHITADRVRDTTTTTGTSALAVSGTAPSGYRSFSAVCSTSDTFFYCISHQTADEWETGLGAYSSANTITRTTVIASSNSNSAVNFSAGTKDVFITLAAGKTVQLDASGNATALGTVASATLTNATGLPISTGVSGLGTGVATFLATPSSSNLASAVTGETGSGALVFGTTPTLTGLNETKTAPSISSNTLTLDCAAGNVFAVSLNANINTLTFSNVPASGTAYGLTLSLTADGTARTVTWGSAVKWPGGTAPTLTSTNAKVDTFVLYTHDGGTTWYASISGQNA